MKKTLRPYQVEDLAFMINNPRILNRSEPATGKTGSACAYAEYVWKYEGGSTIFVQPKSIIRKNLEELLAFADFEREDLFVFDPKRVDKLKRPPKVLLTTADSLTRNWGLMKALMAKPPKLFIGDEMHLYYSTDGTKRTQHWYSVMKEVPRMLAMTGTAIRGRMDSAYPIINVIEPRYYGTVGRFMMEHSVQDSAGKVLGWTGYDKLGRILLAHGINRTFAECYGAEKKVILPVPLEMSVQQAQAYDQFHTLAMLELEGEEVLSATSEGVHAIRCRQLLAHPESMGVAGWKAEVNVKDQWVLDALLPQYGSGLLFAVLRPEQERLVATLKKAGARVALINGGTSLAQRSRIDQEFQEGKLDWIVASPATAGVGFNWQRAECVAFVSCDYMDDNVVQAYRRAIRGVRETPLPIYIPQYVGTIEDRILEIIEKKSRLASLVDKTREALKGLRAR